MTTADSPPPRIELRRLTRKLPSGDRVLTILDAVDLSIAAGELVAVLGPSGSGKSTLLALMAGLDRPTAGEVLLDGEPIQDLSEDAPRAPPPPQDRLRLPVLPAARAT